MEDFGGSEDDDVDCLFFIYARFLTDNQEGMQVFSLSEQRSSLNRQELCASHQGTVSCQLFTVV